MIVRVERSSLSEVASVASITDGLSLHEILALANRIVDQVEMSVEQHRRQEIVFTYEWGHPASTGLNKPYRIVFRPYLWYMLHIQDFEAVLIEELQHASDLDKMMKSYVSDGIRSASHYAGSLLEFRAIVQMTRLRPVGTVRMLFRDAVWDLIRVLDPDRLWWCLTVTPSHLRQAVKNAMLPQYLVQMLAQALRAQGHIVAAAAIVKEEE